MTAQAKPESKKINAVILAFVVVGFAIAYGYSWYMVIGYPRAIEYEGTMLWAADTIAQGQNIYDPARLSAPPWHVITYPPLFICIAAVLIKLFGPMFWCLRIITIGGAIASVILLYRLLRLSGCSPMIAAIAPAYFMGFSPTFVWNNCGRPDCVATALCLAGLERLYSAFLQIEREKRWMPSAVMAGVFLALSCMSKQTSVVCAVSGLLFVIWCKRARLAGVVAAVMGCALLLMAGAAQLLTGGFIQNMAYFGKTHWQQDLLMAHLHFMSDGDIQRCEILLAVLLFCVVVRKQQTTVPERLPYVFFGLSFLNMIYMLGLPDSNGNHAILFLLAMSWWLALKCKTLPVVAARIVLLASLVGTPFLAQYFADKIAQLPKDQLVLDQVDLKGKSVLAEDPSLNILSRSEPAMIDCAVFEAVWGACEPDRIATFEQAVAHHDFAALIINCPDLDGTSRMIWPATTVKVFKDSDKSVGKLSGNGVCQQLLLPR